MLYCPPPPPPPQPAGYKCYLRFKPALQAYAKVLSNTVSPKCQSARGMQGHSNKIKQEFGLTDFPKASFRVNAGTKQRGSPCYTPLCPIDGMDGRGCNNLCSPAHENQIGSQGATQFNDNLVNLNKSYSTGNRTHITIYSIHYLPFYAAEPIGQMHTALEAH